MLRDLKKRRSEQHVTGWVMAFVHLGLGNREDALSALEEAVGEQDGLVSFINVWSPLEALRPEPRVQALLRRMNFHETPTPTTS